MDMGTSSPAWFVLTRHWLSLADAALLTTAGIPWLIVLPLNIRSRVKDPYVGIALLLILPVSHLGPGVYIRSAAMDATRQTIPWVEYRNTSTGDAQTFVSSDSSPDSVTRLPIYEMQLRRLSDSENNSVSSSGPRKLGSNSSEQEPVAQRGKKF